MCIPIRNQKELTQEGTMSYVMLKQGLGAEIVMVLIPSRHTSAIMCLRILMCFNDFFTAICKTIECILLNEKLLVRT